MNSSSSSGANANASSGGGGEGSNSGGGPRLKILLTLVDVDDAEPALADVNVAALRRGFVLICAFSAPEAARYLELFRAFESKPADVIRGRAGEDYLSRLNAALTSVRGVNKTDVLALGAAFGTAAGILSAPGRALAAVPGVGPTKARRLAAAFHEPFFKTYNGSSSTANAIATATRGPKQSTQARLVVGGGGGGGSGAPSLRVAPPSSSSLPPPEKEGGGGGGGDEGEPRDEDEEEEDEFFAAVPAVGTLEAEVQEIMDDDDADEMEEEDGVGIVE